MTLNAIAFKSVFVPSAMLSETHTIITNSDEMNNNESDDSGFTIITVKSTFVKSKNIF